MVLPFFFFERQTRKIFNKLFEEIAKCCCLFIFISNLVLSISHDGYEQNDNANYLKAWNVGKLLSINYWFTCVLFLYTSFFIEFINKIYTQLLHAHSVHWNFIALVQRKRVIQTELFKHIRFNSSKKYYITFFWKLKSFIDT